MAPVCCDKQSICVYTLYTISFERSSKITVRDIISLALRKPRAVFDT